MNKKCPTVKIINESDDSRGYYSPSNNTITLVATHFENDTEKIIQTFEFFSKNKIENTQKYLMTNIPIFFLDSPKPVTLIHELTHAWNKDKGHEFHNPMPHLKIKDVFIQDIPSFYTGGYLVYNKICSLGLFDEFKKVLN